MQFKGECFGVKVTKRDDPFEMITIMVEDDDSWHDKVSLSAYWLDELIYLLQKARKTSCERKQIVSGRIDASDHCQCNPSGALYEHRGVRCQRCGKLVDEKTAKRFIEYNTPKNKKEKS